MAVADKKILTAERSVTQAHSADAADKKEESMMIEKAFLTVKEVSQLINLGRTKTYEAVRAGRIPKVVIEGCIRVPASALQDWIAERSSLEGPTMQTAQIAGHKIGSTEKTNTKQRPARTAAINRSAKSR